MNSSSSVKYEVSKCYLMFKKHINIYAYFLDE
jgi:hypothetical protein